MSASTKSPWFELTPQPEYGALDGDIHADVAIVGAGITGLTAAVLLKRAGKTVALIDKSDVAGGESGYTTAHITEIIDTRYHTLISKFGKEGARLAARASRDAIERIASFVEEKHIACDFRRLPGYLYTESSQDVETLKEESEAARSAGIDASLVYSVPLPYPTRAAMKVENQAQFHPRSYLLALAEEIPGNGSHIFQKTRMIDCEEGEPCRITTERGTIVADSMIFATNTPCNNRVFLHTKIYAYRTYALGALLKSAEPLPGLFWDTANPYHYIRSHTFPGFGELLIVGGEDHKTGTVEDTQECFNKLKKFALERFIVDSVPYHWSGQIMEPADGLPYIGKNSLSQHVYVATGYTGNGMTFGTLAGMLLCDAICGTKNPYTDLFDATRIKPFAAAAEFISENSDVAAHYISDWLSKGDGARLEDIPNDSGRTITVDGEKMAVYRDEKGEIHAFSPVCPHLGCQVHWNNAEKTWDCPCHGSRFDPLGKVANGPSLSDLKPIDVHAKQANELKIKN